MFRWLREIKWFIQRGRRGYADCDGWNFDEYFSRLIIHSLKHLKKNKIGCPSELYDASNKNNECWKWGEILEEIIQGFEASLEIIDGCFSRIKKDQDGNYRLSIKEFEPKREQLSKKFDRGMNLFHEYFFGLWD